MMDDEREIAALLRKSLSRLQDFGLRLAVLLSGHFAETQLAMIDRIAADWNRSIGPLQVLATAVNRIEGLSNGPDHAGLFETTLLSALHPDLVRIDRLPSLSEAPLPPGDSDFSPNRHDPKHPIWGVFGPDPRRFDPATAAGLLSSSVDWLVGEVKKTLR
jgi:creatinine amidohydrolase